MADGTYGWSTPPPVWEPPAVATAAPARVSLHPGWLVGGGVALVVVGALLGAALAFFAGGFAAPGGWALVVGARGDLATFDLAPGDCAVGVLEGDQLPATPTAVPCAAAHEIEVYAVSAPLDADAYPDAVALHDYAFGWCSLEFDAYVGRDYYSSAYEMWPVVPDQEAWDAGERQIACLASSLDGVPLTGSVAGTAR